MAVVGGKIRLISRQQDKLVKPGIGLISNPKTSFGTIIKPYGEYACITTLILFRCEKTCLHAQVRAAVPAAAKARRVTEH
jgi:hypothetical protein